MQPLLGRLCLPLRLWRGRSPLRHMPWGKVQYCGIVGMSLVQWGLRLFAREQLCHPSRRRVPGRKVRGLWGQFLHRLRSGLQLLECLDLLPAPRRHLPRGEMECSRGNVLQRLQ